MFDRLEMAVLIEIASQIAPRKMSDILGLMSPEAAERLTVEMARRANGGGDQSAAAARSPQDRRQADAKAELRAPEARRAAAARAQSRGRSACTRLDALRV